MNTFIRISTLLIFFICQGLFAADTTPNFTAGAPFIRDHEGKIQLAKKSYRDQFGNKITLLAAIHFAEKEFYRLHAQLLGQADKVLFEGKGLDKEGLAFLDSPLGKQTQKVANPYRVYAKAFDLAYQRDAIDYSLPHFILADYTFAQVAELAGFSSIDEHIKSFEHQIKEFWGYYPDEVDPLQYEHDKSVREWKARGLNVFVEQLTPTISQDPKTLLTPKLYEQELIARNDIVYKRLAELFTDTLVDTHIAIQYGAAHLNFFEEHILEKYGFVPEAEEWLTAFSY